MDRLFMTLSFVMLTCLPQAKMSSSEVPMMKFIEKEKQRRFQMKESIESIKRKIKELEIKTHTHSAFLVYAAGSIDVLGSGPLKGFVQDPVVVEKFNHYIQRKIDGGPSDSGTANNDETISDDKTPQTFEEIALRAYNILRKIHGSPELKLDLGLTKRAKLYAEKLAKLGMDEVGHDSWEETGGRNEGETYHMFCVHLEDKEYQYNATVPVVDWYKEVCEEDYPFGSKNGTHRHDQFKQVVWKETTSLGIGMARAIERGNTCYYAVARYRPWGGAYPTNDKNVLKGNFTKEKVCGYRSEKINEILKKGGMP